MGIAPAQLLAFSTSSSAATLPLTMERCEEQLGVSKTVTSFVLPLGATIDMDGTSCYQAVAAVFIAQVYGMDLGLSAQLTIVLTATLASIGSAAVPGARYHYVSHRFRFGRSSLRRNKLNICC